MATGVECVSVCEVFSRTCLLVAELLQAVYSDLCANPCTHDITVEDPSDGFVRLRDFVDCRLALRLPAFQPPTIHSPFEGEILEAARDRLRLHKVLSMAGTLSCPDQ